MISIGIITAEREIPTLSYSIKSLRNAGYNGKLYVFAEPGKHQIEGDNISLIVHKERKGAFTNYDFALNYLHENTTEELILVASDDVVYSKILMNKIEEISNDEKPFGYYTLLTCKSHPGTRENVKNEGWNDWRIGVDAWGGMYIMRRNIVTRLLRNEYYNAHKEGRSNRPEKFNKMIDGAVSQSILLMNLPMYYHNPTLCYTIGHTSTLNHNQSHDGYNWKG